MTQQTRIRRSMKRAICMMGIVLTVATSGFAATTITIDSVTQRWPWNNKVDIAYTVVGGQDLSTSNFCKIVFTTVINGTTYTIDGVKDVGASANPGSHIVTWTAPAGVKSSNCTMSAVISESDAPSGDDYLVIDLTKDSDNIAFEGLLATQDESNGRYNTDVYKTDKLVLRKVPVVNPHGMSYVTGNTAYFSSSTAPSDDKINTDKTWTLAYDYYIGIFPVTQRQYKNVYGSNPSAVTAVDSASNRTAHRPVETVSWNDLRLADTPSTSPIPTVTSKTGTFFQRLNYVTGNKFGFDLPTEVMFEIAARCGVSGRYTWGPDQTQVPKYAVNSNNSGGFTMAVGSRDPRRLGLYDMTGDVYEWCLDCSVPGDMANRTDPFTPAYDASIANRRTRGGGHWNQYLTEIYFYASYRGSADASSKSNGRGFRVAWIVR